MRVIALKCRSISLGRYSDPLLAILTWITLVKSVVIPTFLYPHRRSCNIAWWTFLIDRINRLSSHWSVPCLLKRNNLIVLLRQSKAIQATQTRDRYIFILSSSRHKFTSSRGRAESISYWSPSAYLLIVISRFDLAISQRPQVCSFSCRHFIPSSLFLCRKCSLIKKNRLDSNIATSILINLDEWCLFAAASSNVWPAANPAAAGCAESAVAAATVSADICDVGQEGGQVSAAADWHHWRFPFFLLQRQHATKGSDKRGEHNQCDRCRRQGLLSFRCATCRL